MTDDKGEPYKVDDLDNSCGDEECCGISRAMWSVYLPVRGWKGYFEDLDKAKRMARLCKRWGVK